MRSFFLTFVMAATFTSVAMAQKDSSALLPEAERELRNRKADVSSVLTNKAYVSLHSESSFRELIQSHAPTGTLSIAADDEPGERVKIFVSVKNQDGKPVVGAMVYLYQTDSRGWYSANAPHVQMNEGDFRHARLFGYVKTDKNGMIELHTIKPSGYPQSDLPAHIHVQVIAGGYREYNTEFLFQDDDRLKGEVLNRAIVDGGMIAEPETATPPFQQKFSYVIILKADN